MVQMTHSDRLPWLLGIANGLLAIAAVDAVYTALSGPGIWVVPMWLAAPYAAFTAWRANAYVRGVLAFSASHLRPPVEGFVLMAISTVGYGLYMASRAGAEGAPFVTATFPYAVYAVPVGCLGALIAVVLMLFDGAVVRSLRPMQRSTASR
jgi:hypothetical protein